MLVKLMAVEVARLGESLVAQIAFVRLLAGVDSTMAFEGVRLGESLVALVLFTDERLLAGVGQQMRHEPGRSWSFVGRIFPRTFEDFARFHNRRS